MTRRPLLVALACMIVLVTAGGTASAQKAMPRIPRDSMTSFAVGGWGLALGDRDSRVRPGDDFYRSQNGAWIADSARLAREASSAYWRDLKRLAPRREMRMLQEAAANSTASPRSPEGMAGTFYRAFMNVAAIEAKGMTPLTPQLDAIRSVTNKSQLARVMGQEAGPLMPRAVNLANFTFPPALFAIDVQRDSRDQNRNAVYIRAAGLLLPSPDYYSDPKLADIEGAYRKYIERLLAMVGWDRPAQRADEIVALETRLAAVSWTLEQMGDVIATDNPMTTAELTKLAPEFDWQSFMAGADIPKVSRVIIDTKSAFPNLVRIFAETPLDVWQARQAFAVADLDIRNLNEAAMTAAVDFRGKLFNGSAVTAGPRQGRAALAADLSIPDIMGTLYTARYIPPAAIATARAMAEQMRGALDARFAASTWLSAETKTRLRRKLAAMKLNIGAPEHPTDYSGLTFSDTDFYANVIAARTFDWQRRVHRLSEPFSRDVWPLPPQNVSYANSPITNVMEIPAGSLEPPFFDLTADAAVNYGAIGTIIGQMIIAGFDDAGLHFDDQGRRADLLTSTENVRFLAMKKQIVDAYSAIEPLPGLHAPGELYFNEAFRDIGGLTIAFDAYKASLHGKAAPVMDGFTGEQRFFLGWAQMWRASFPPEFTRSQLTVGFNAPPFLRVNGPAPHVDAWYDAFHVQPGDAMYLDPGKRVRLW